MRTFSFSLVALSILFVVGSLLGPAPVVVAQDAPDGKAIFEAQKCSLCHGVEAAGIEAKTKSEKLQGPDLSGFEAQEGFDVKAFVRKQLEKDGEAHRREFKGTDEELQAMLDWLKSTKS